ncbi:hypothetical protein DAI22_11g239800 [Oryza sativa Japonica Group]|nr:hypothetical protein DAI22_11g239800 [Oryza sativa Japonica Group]
MRGNVSSVISGGDEAFQVINDPASVSSPYVLLYIGIYPFKCHLLQTSVSK